MINLNFFNFIIFIKFQSHNKNKLSSFDIFNETIHLSIKFRYFRVFLCKILLINYDFMNEFGMIKIIDEIYWLLLNKN